VLHNQLRRERGEFDYSGLATLRGHYCSAADHTEDCEMNSGDMGKGEEALTETLLGIRRGT
jgi:hypothetical protein